MNDPRPLAPRPFAPRPFAQRCLALRRSAARTLAALLPGAACLAILCPLSAQKDQADLKARRDAKLASAFLKKNAWITDFDQAIAAARKNKKVIFGYFTRSFAP